MNKIDLPYRVFRATLPTTATAKWKIARFPDEDASDCKFLETLALAQAEANKENKRRNEKNNE